VKLTELARAITRELDGFESRLMQEAMGAKSRAKEFTELQRQHEITLVELETNTRVLAKLEIEVQDSKYRLSAAAHDQQDAVKQLETERQLRIALEAQIAAAERHKKSDLDGLEMERKSWRNSLEQVREQITKEREEHRNTLEQLFAEITTLKKASVTAITDTRAVSVGRNPSPTSPSEGQKLSKMNKELREQVDQLAELLRAARAELIDCNSAMHRQELRHAEELASCKRNLDKLEAKGIRSTQSHIHSLSSELSTMTMNVSHLQHALDEATSNLAQETMQNTSLRLQIEELQTYITKLRLASETETSELSALRETIKTLEDRQKAIEMDRDSLRKQLHSGLHLRLL